MSYDVFISSLSDEDKKNYNKYSKIRGPQQYRIIYEALYKINPNVTYKDVNSFIKLDKAIKDILFKYLGTLEEIIKNDIFLKYDFDSIDGLKDKYIYFDNKFPKSKCIRRINAIPYELTEFYKRFALNFGGIVLFIKEFMENEYDCKQLDTIVELRNNVMHHSLLLFNYNFESTAEDTIKKIKVLIDLLPKEYTFEVDKDKKGIIENLKYVNSKTKENIAKAYYKCLMFKEN